MLGRKAKGFCDDCFEYQRMQGWLGHIDCERSADETAERMLGSLPEAQRELGELYAKTGRGAQARAAFAAAARGFDSLGATSRADDIRQRADAVAG